MLREQLTRNEIGDGVKGRRNVAAVGWQGDCLDYKLLTILAVGNWYIDKLSVRNAAEVEFLWISNFERHELQLGHNQWNNIEKYEYAFRIDADSPSWKIHRGTRTLLGSLIILAQSDSFWTVFSPVRLHPLPPALVRKRYFFNHLSYFVFKGQFFFSFQRATHILPTFHENFQCCPLSTPPVP
jgi:hypothetical protein